MQQNYYARTEINQRDTNEDYYNLFAVSSKTAKPGEQCSAKILVVADGMGGHEHGEEVSRQAVLKVEDFLKKTLTSDLHDINNPAHLKAQLLNAIKSANTLVQRMTEANGWGQAGATIVVAAICQNTVVAANLGDSPLFHFTHRTQELIRVTQDHSVPGILAQAKLITEEMARCHERRGQLEFYLGAKTLPIPDPVYQRPLETGDLLLLCSDGISGALTLEQIQAILAQPETTLEAKADELIQAARLAGETDNQTVILWQHDKSALIPPPQQLNQRSHRRPPRLRLRLDLVTLCIVGAIAAILASAGILQFYGSAIQTVIPFFIKCVPALVAITPAPPPTASTQPLDLKLEFKKDGTVLITKDPAGTLMRWGNVQLSNTFRLPAECSPAVPSKTQPQQKLVKINSPTHPETLETRGSDGCVRVWTRQDKPPALEKSKKAPPGKLGQPALGKSVVEQFKVLENRSESLCGA